MPVIVIPVSERIPLRSHDCGSKRWYFLSGHGLLNIDNDSKYVNGGDNVYISRHTKYRLTNVSSSDALVFIETPFGDIRDYIMYEE